MRVGCPGMHSAARFALSGGRFIKYGDYPAASHRQEGTRSKAIYIRTIYRLISTGTL
jgi:hypothetical protein